MEGAGSRLGRASSRYSQQRPPPFSSSSPANFSGPVRKWQKKWVLVSGPYVARKSSKKGDNPRGVLLCKWTPLSRPQNSDDDASATGIVEEPPRRKFRYTPVAAVEELKEEGLRNGINNNIAKTAGKEDNPTAARVVEEEQRMGWNSAAIHGHGMVKINECPMAYYQVADDELLTNQFHHPGNSSLFNLGV